MQRDIDADAVLTVAHSMVGAITDLAEWLQPDAVTATSMTLVETVHAIILAAAAAAVKDPAKTLDDIIDRTNGHVAGLARQYYERFISERQT